MMIGEKLIAGAFAVVLGGFVPMLAQSAATQPAANDDPNWIGPNSWERRFTIPVFVETPKGMAVKVATTRPASEAPTVTTIRHRRAPTSTTAGSTASRGRGYSSRLEGSSRRTERRSRPSRMERSSRGRY